MFKKLFFSLILLGGSFYLFSFANYEPSTHDYEFAQMLQYKIQDTFQQRGPDAKPEVVGILHVFAQKYEHSNPRFSWLMHYLAEKLENSINEYAKPDHSLPTEYNLQCQSPASEINAPIQINSVKKLEDKIIFSFSRNPQITMPAYLPNKKNLEVSGLAHCSAWSKKPIPGGSETLSIYGVRGKPYSLGLPYQELVLGESLDTTKTITGTMNIPDTLASGDYSFMCQIIVQQVNPKDEEKYAGSWDSVYYYFDVINAAKE